jgi:RNA polymerase sigma-70 factor (ECF subfamily)
MPHTGPETVTASESAGTDFKAELLTHLPAMRAFARSLCSDASRADDLVQDAVLRAWASKQSFTLGTNMKAWLFTILRNGFYSEIRRRKRDVEDPEGTLAGNLSVPAAQQDHLDLQDLRRGLSLLPVEQREALILVGASGCSYEEAAAICDCAVGTIKSRVSRARRSLLAHFEGNEVEGSSPVAESGPASASASERPINPSMRSAGLLR